MKNIISFAALLLIFSQYSLAGTQTSTRLDQATYSIDNNMLLVSGLSKGKEVTYHLTSVIVRGQIGQVNCSVKSLPCAGRLRLNADKMTLNIGIDQDQDGNYETVLKGVEVGSVSQNSVLFSAPAQSFFIQDRYSFLEKLKGLEDKEYVVLELTLSL